MIESDKPSTQQNRIIAQSQIVNMSRPIVAAHLLVSSQDDDDWAKNTFPTLRLDAVDHLIISAFVVSNTEGSFILEDEARLGPRVKAVVKKTREEAQKTGRTVKIFALQWWGSTTGIVNLTSAEQKKKYVESIPGILTKYDLDGYDIDYEPNEVNNGNLAPWAPVLLNDIRKQLDQLGAQKNRKYYLAITPSTPAFLHPKEEAGKSLAGGQFNSEAKDFPVTKTVDYVNVQTYDGGFGAENSARVWINDVGFAPSQVLFGICSEETQDKTGKRSSMPNLLDALNAYQGDLTGQVLGGIHVWRLNGNTPWSNKVQAVLFNWFHDVQLKDSLTLKAAVAGWKKNTA